MEAEAKDFYEKEGSISWIFYNCSDHEIRGFRGIGGRDGGRFINRYPDVARESTTNIDLAVKPMWALNLKAVSKHSDMLSATRI